MDNLRLNIDSFHKAGEPEKPLFLASNFSEDFLGTDSNLYRVTVEKAEFPIANMDIFLNTKEDLWITFEDGRKSDREVKVIKGGFKNIQQFIDAINSVLDNYESGVSYGKFTFDSDSLLISYEADFSGPEHPINVHDVKIYFSQRLRYFLDFMSGGFYSNPNSKGESRLGLKQEADFKSVQEISTAARMYEFKAIRIFSPSLNLAPYFLYDHESKTLVRTTMLTEIVLNSAMYSSGNTNILYIPSVFRYSDIQSGGLSIRNITFYALVHYATGEDVNLITKPSDYTSITLAFSLKK